MVAGPWMRSFGLIVSGPESARAELLDDFTEPVRDRVERLGSTLDRVDYAGHTAEAIGTAIQMQRDAGRQLVIVAGVSAVFGASSGAAIVSGRGAEGTSAALGSGGTGLAFGSAGTWMGFGST